MLDADLASIYGVSTKRLNQAVHRNPRRFPPDFMFRLDPRESSRLRSQIVTSKKGRGGPRYLPLVFTEHGAVMLSSILRTSVAVDASIAIARAFVRFREFLATHAMVAKRLARFENRLDRQDAKIKTLLDAIEQLMAPPEERPREIGFRATTE